MDLDWSRSRSCVRIQFVALPFFFDSYPHKLIVILTTVAGNVPGAVIAGWGGSRLGAIRDAKGKAVYEVFKELGSEQKAEVLKALIAKVFGMAGIGGNISA